MTPIHNFNPPDSGRQAPSEKHLEDYLWEHPEVFGRYGESNSPFITFRLRQFALPSGIADLIGTHTPCDIAVFELKKGRVGTRALAQLFRYMHDVDTVYDMAMRKYEENCYPYYEYLWPRAKSGHIQRRVMGYLVGTTIDPDILPACRYARIVPVEYDYDPETETYCFSEKEDVSTWLTERRQCAPFLNSELGSIAFNALNQTLRLHHITQTETPQDYPDQVPVMKELVETLFEMDGAS